jgi:DNA-binding MarR family transcriptional regulator
MSKDNKLTLQMAELIFQLRQKCAAKDSCFVKPLDVSVAEYNCLVQFFETATFSVKELAERLDITPGGVTRIITSLEERGYIQRTISSEDRRGIKVTLTERGCKIVSEIREASIQLHGNILEQIKPEKRKQVLEGIKRLNSALDAWLVEHQAEVSHKK